MTSAHVRDGEAGGLGQGVPDHEVVIIGAGFGVSAPESN